MAQKIRERYQHIPSRRPNGACPPGPAGAVAGMARRADRVRDVVTAVIRRPPPVERTSSDARFSLSPIRTAANRPSTLTGASAAVAGPLQERWGAWGARHDVRRELIRPAEASPPPGRLAPVGSLTVDARERLRLPGSGEVRPTCCGRLPDPHPWTGRLADRITDGKRQTIGRMPSPPQHGRQPLPVGLRERRERPGEFHEMRVDGGVRIVPGQVLDHSVGTEHGSVPQAVSCTNCTGFCSAGNGTASFLAGKWGLFDSPPVHSMFSRQ
ncbi:MAG: hypothetical protein AB7U20_03255 [Planctomycetaceae bacterium]